MEKIKPIDNESNQKNPNEGTTGTNLQYDKTQGNRGKQLNPNQIPQANKKVVSKMDGRDVC